MDAVVAPDTTVFSFLVVLRYQVEGERRFRALVVLPDSMSHDALRRLRLWLRWATVAARVNDGVA